MAINDISDLIFDHIDNNHKTSIDKIKLMIHNYTDRQREISTAENDRQTNYVNKYESRRLMQDDLYKQFLYDREELYKKWKADRSKATLYEMLNMKFDMQDIPEIYTNTVVRQPAEGLKQRRDEEPKPKEKPKKIIQKTKDLPEKTKDLPEKTKDDPPTPKKPLSPKKAHIVQTVPKKDQPHCPINNLGNSCYINSSLQYLMHIQPFNDIVMQHKDHNNITKAYADLYDAYMTKNVPEQTIKNLVNSLNDSLNNADKFSVEEQMDAYEFMMKLIEKMEIPELEKLFEVNTQTHFDFHTTITKGKKELKCEEEKDIQNIPYTSVILQFNDKKKVYNINDELRVRYDGLIEEVTKKADYINCNTVIDTEKNKALPKPEKFPYTKTDTITTFPDVLRVNLAIFNNKLKKSFIKSEIPNKWQYNDHTYILKGIIVHLGESLGSGHYEYFSLEADGKWYQYSDCNITVHKPQKPKLSYHKLTANPDDVNIFYTNKSQPCPYILYYARI